MSVVKEKCSKVEADISGFHIFCSDKKNFNHLKEFRKLSKKSIKVLRVLKKSCLNLKSDLSGIKQEKRSFENIQNFAFLR